MDESTRTQRAVTKAATNWGAIAVFGIAMVAMCLMAGDLKDGSELKTAAVTVAFGFPALFLGYYFTGRRDQ